MNRNLAVLIAAVSVNVVAAALLNFVSSLALTWLLLSVIFASAGVTIYAAWVRVHAVRPRTANTAAERSGVWTDDAPPDRAPAQTKSASTDKVSSLETRFRCAISDKTGLLVTYVGPDSCELFRLLDAIREFRRPAAAQ